MEWAARTPCGRVIQVAGPAVDDAHLSLHIGLSHADEAQAGLGRLSLGDCGDVASSELGDGVLDEVVNPRAC